MASRDQDAPGGGERSPGSGTLAGLLLRGRPAPKEPESKSADRVPASTPGQMNLLFTAPAATGTPPQEHSQPEKPVARNRPAAPVASPPGSAETERRIWTVQALVGDVRQSLELAYDSVLVQGEISNCRPAASGHLYFTLRDGDAQLAVVLFRRHAQLLRFAPRDGMEVLVRGRISLYDQRGQLQLLAETLEPRGAGSLQLAFEQLKAKLLAEGLFDAARKRPLPQFPQRVGVITSPSGAVVHDIVRVVRRRHACLDLLIFPAAVQGAECSGSVIQGLRWFNQMASSGSFGSVDLIVIARGGGSLEDLAGFNDEALARAVADSALPVVAAVGHETDFTIADFVADLRAPTPSAAAELITAAQHRIEERVHGLAGRLDRAIRYRTMLASQRYTRLSAPQILARVHNGIDRRTQRLEQLRRELETAAARRLERAKAAHAAIAQRLGRRDPAAGLLAARHRAESARRVLDPAIARAVERARTRLERVEARLTALSPLAVLARGYALVYGPDGSLLRDSAKTAPGDMIRARLKHGSITAQVVSPGSDQES